MSFETLLSSSGTTGVTPPQRGGVTPRVVALSVMLAVCFGYLIPLVDYRLTNTFLGGTHLPPGAVGVLLFLLAVNPLLRLFGKGLTQNEALAVYITCLFSCILPGHGAETFLIPNLIAPFYYATRENRWLEFLQPSLQPWLTPSITADGALNPSVYRDGIRG